MGQAVDAAAGPRPLQRAFGRTPPSPNGGRGMRVVLHPPKAMCFPSGPHALCLSLPWGSS